MSLDILINKLLQWVLQKLRIYFYKFLSNAKINGRVILYQPLQTVGMGGVEFLGKVSIGVFPSPYFLSTYAYIEVRNPGSQIRIGDLTCINNGFTAIAEYSEISIGSRVLIGTNVEIYDSDFHGISLQDRTQSKREWSKPVVIEDDVFLGSNVRVMKGVTIGQGAVIACGSVVVNDIPRNVVAGGNPARILKSI